MTRTSLVLDVPLERVWAVLADARTYGDWVVGAKEVRRVEGSWPEPGSRFHHTVGFGPFQLRDDTKSIEADSPWRLVIEARARPLGRAQVEFVLTPVAAGTEVEMTETLVSPSPLKLLNPVLAPLIRRRNDESLRRLGKLAGAAVTGPQGASR